MMAVLCKLWYGQLVVKVQPVTILRTANKITALHEGSSKIFFKKIAEFL
jgi:hypothetical protein